RDRAWAHGFAGAVRLCVEMRFFAITPAAGKSRRMGQAKLTLPWRGSTIIEVVLNAWRQSKATEIIVVVNNDDLRLIELCKTITNNVVLVDGPPEMKDSIQHGLAFARDSLHASDGDAWLLAPADLPGLCSPHIDAVIDAF